MTFEEWRTSLTEEKFEEWRRCAFNQENRRRPKAVAAT